MLKSLVFFKGNKKRVSNIDKISTKKTKKNVFIVHRYFLKRLDMGISN